MQQQPWTCAIISCAAIYSFKSTKSRAYFATECSSIHPWHTRADPLELGQISGEEQHEAATAATGKLLANRRTLPSFAPCQQPGCKHLRTR